MIYSSYYLYNSCLVEKKITRIIENVSHLNRARRTSHATEEIEKKRDAHKKKDNSKFPPKLLRIEAFVYDYKMSNIFFVPKAIQF